MVLSEVLLAKRNIVTLQHNNGSNAVKAEYSGMRNAPIMKMALLFVTVVSCTTKHFNITHLAPVFPTGLQMLRIELVYMRERKICKYQAFVIPYARRRRTTTVSQLAADHFVV
ncbi:UNVERIFIED_CONTAM: hypothetical protein NCL1_31189 [Trichonephila clavipes]